MPETLKVEDIFISKNGSQYIVIIYISTDETYYTRKDIIETKNKITGILSKDHPYLSLDMIPEGNPVQESQWEELSLLLKPWQLMSTKESGLIKIQDNMMEKLQQAWNSRPTLTVWETGSLVEETSIRKGRQICQRRKITLFTILAPEELIASL